MSWKTVHLKDVAIVSAGNSAPQDESLFEGGVYNFYRTSDVGRIRKGVISNSLDKLNLTGIKGLKLFAVGTILFPKSGASTFLNHRVILGNEGYVSSHLATIKAKNEFLDDKYLFYFLTTIDARDLIQDSSYPSLRTSVIETVELQLPPLPTQQKIVAKLDAIFAEIDKAQAAAEANAKNADALFQSYLAEVFETDQHELIKLKDCCNIKPPKSEAKRLEGNQKVSFMPMEALGINQKFSMPNQIRTLESVSGSYTYFAENDVLLAKITPCFENGKLGIARNLVNEIGFGSSEYIVFRPTNNVNNEWLYYFLNRESFRIEGAKNMSGAVGHKRVTKEFIENSMLPVPSLEEQKKLVEAIANIHQETEKLKRNSEIKINQLTALKNVILQQAFSGELVKD